MCFGAHVPGGVRNETRGVASFLLIGCSRRATGPHSALLFGAALVQACVAVSLSLVSQWRCVVNAVVMISHEELYTRNVAAMHVLELG